MVLFIKMSRIDKSIEADKVYWWLVRTEGDGEIEQ